MKLKTPSQTKIFIIERERIIGLALKKSLEKIGFRVEHPKSVIKGKTILKKFKPDFVIIDDSVFNQKFLKLIKINSENSKLKIIHIAANQAANFIIDENKSNTIRKFQKPFDSNELINYINRHLSKK